eukprot:gene822-989_t
MTNSDTAKKDALKASMRELIKQKRAAKSKAAPSTKPEPKPEFSTSISEKVVEKKVQEIKEIPVVEKQVDKVERLSKDWDKILEDEMDSDDSDMDADTYAQLNKIYMDAEKDWHKEMRNYDEIKKEDGWDELVKVEKESANTFKHPHKPRPNDKLPSLTPFGEPNP